MGEQGAGIWEDSLGCPEEEGDNIVLGVEENRDGVSESSYLGYNCFPTNTHVQVCIGFWRDSPPFLPLYIRIKSASDKAWPIHPRDAANTASGK